MTGRSADCREESEQPVGVFDSGVGGLSVLRALERRLPNENYIYFGDTARAPYGNRSPGEIRRFNLEIGKWLLDQQCKMLLVACNTSTVLGGLEALRNSTAKSVFGMMEAILSGVTDTDGPIGFIATQGTVDSGAYQKAFAEKFAGTAFIARACPDFVPLVERGETSGPDVARAVEAYLTPLREQGVCTLVLGCTHYPYLAPVISAFLGDGVRLSDPADALASIVEAHLCDTGLLNNGVDSDGFVNTATGGAGGERSFYCSGDTESFRFVGQIMLGRPLGEVKRQVFI